MYLYRVVDERGRTVESHLSRTRDIAATRAFFRHALKRHGQPRPITLMASTEMRSYRAWACETSSIAGGKTPVKIRSCPYLSNLVEQDHRA